MSDIIKNDLEYEIMSNIYDIVIIDEKYDVILSREEVENYVYDNYINPIVEEIEVLVKKLVGNINSEERSTGIAAIDRLNRKNDIKSLLSSINSKYFENENNLKLVEVKRSDKIELFIDEEMFYTIEKLECINEVRRELMKYIENIILKKGVYLNMKLLKTIIENVVIDKLS